MEIKISVPGSKSIANRALLLNALTGNRTKLKNLPQCDDTKYMIQGLKKLASKNPKIRTGNAGTTTRFLTAYATLLNKKVTIDGDKRMRERPIQALVDALNQLGTKVETKNGCPPVTIYPKKPVGGEVRLPGNISSQYLSGILMIAAFCHQKTTITIEQKLYSRPYVEMTIKLMKSFGIKITNKNFRQFVMHPQIPKPPSIYDIEADASSASYIGAFAALNSKKSVILKNINKKSIQGDIKFLDYLKKMGCTVKQMSADTKIQGPKKLKSLGTVNMNETPDLVMTFAVLAAFANGRTKITNIGNLRIKETDRLKALENELKKLGVKVQTGRDYIEIEGINCQTITGDRHAASPKGERSVHSDTRTKKRRFASLRVSTYNDHRIAMAFGILTTKFPQIKIENPNCVSKSYTTFWHDLKKLKNGR